MWVRMFGGNFNLTWITFGHLIFIRITRQLSERWSKYGKQPRKDKFWIRFSHRLILSEVSRMTKNFTRSKCDPCAWPLRINKKEKRERQLRARAHVLVTCTEQHPQPRIRMRCAAKRKWTGEDALRLTALSGCTKVTRKIQYWFRKYTKFVGEQVVAGQSGSVHARCFYLVWHKAFKDSN